MKVQKTGPSGSGAFSREESAFLKGIGILLMLFHHLFNDYEEYAGYIVDYRPFTAERLTYLALLGKICVALFVFVNGYGLARSWRKTFDGRKPEKQEISKYLFGRYWKLMSIYWFVFLLTVLCQPLGRTISEAYGGGGKEKLLYLLVDFFGVSYAFSTPTLNPTWWYMSLAIVFLFLAPAIVELMKRYGALPVYVAMILVLQLTNKGALTFYLFSLMMGILCSEARYFEGLSEKKGVRAVLAAVLSFGILILSLKLRTNHELSGFTDSVIALTTASLIHLVLGRIPVLSPVMQFLGRHSAYMFLTHDQIYSFYFTGFFYSFRYWALILVVLTAVSAGVSAGLELIEKKSGYLNFMEHTKERIWNGYHRERNALR